MNINKKYIAEVIGTFGLTSAVILSIATGSAIATPLIAALTLGLFVYSLGHISGGHFNPAVTIGAWSLDKISARHAVYYVVSQLLGALLALGFLANSGIYTPGVELMESLPIVIAELFGTFFFTFGIASVIYGKTPSALSGIVVGGSLLLGIVLAVALGSAGILNPAVALGIGHFNVSYIIGPIFGAILGMQVFKIVGEEK